MNEIEKLSKVINEIDCKMMNLQCVLSSIVITGEACKSGSDIIDELGCTLIVARDYLDKTYNEIGRLLLEAKHSIKTLEEA